MQIYLSGDENYLKNTRDTDKLKRKPYFSKYIAFYFYVNILKYLTKIFINTEFSKYKTFEIYFELIHILGSIINKFRIYFLLDLKYVIFIYIKFPNYKFNAIFLLI